MKDGGGVVVVPPPAARDDCDELISIAVGGRAEAVCRAGDKTDAAQKAGIKQKNGAQLSELKLFLVFTNVSQKRFRGQVEDK